MKQGKKKSRKYYLLIPFFSIGFISILAVTMGNALVMDYAEKWKSAFVTGAVSYEEYETTEMEQEYRIGEGLTKGSLYGKITCSEKELYAPLYYGDTEEILAKGAGTYEGYGIPGEGKTILTGGHDVTYYRPLEDLEAGDIITVTTYWGTYQYRVTEKRIAKVSDISAYPLEEQEKLILYTCYPFGEETKERTERCFVYAVRLEEGDADE